MSRYYNDNHSLDELKHHGILGQKWGVRRYQYEDGSLTPEGKERYGVADRLANIIRNDREARRQKKIQKNRAKSLKKARAAQAAKKEAESKRKKELEKYNLSDKAQRTVKNLDNMSDQEVKNALNRLKDEKSIRDLATDEANAWNAAHPSRITKAMNTINTVSDLVVKVSPAIKASIGIAQSLGMLDNSSDKPKDKNADIKQRLNDRESDLNVRKKKADLKEKELDVRAREKAVEDRIRNENKTQNEEFRKKVHNDAKPSNQNEPYVVGMSAGYTMDQVFGDNQALESVINQTMKDWGLS